jgi:hypothetical protein
MRRYYTEPANASRPTGAGPRPEPEWASWADDRLLDARLCDLGVTLRGSEIESRVRQLQRELAGRDLRFRPHVWLSDDWYCPDGVPGIAVPFYLAHPRLARLEESQMLEVEGGTPESCLRLLRHETGHAIENAYHLRRRRRRQHLFGRSSTRYPEYYVPRPYSRSFVLHLDGWYAQSHPDEDFAETFAIWLTPGSDWRERYAGWPALKKLLYVDTVMREIAGSPPFVSTRRRVDPLGRLRKTLREHYAEKRAHYGVDQPEDLYDRPLRRLFSSAPGGLSAARFLSRIRREVRRKVATWTGVYQYTIDQVLEDMIDRCRELGLRLAVPEEQAKLDFTVLLTVQTMNYLHSGRHRIAV